MGEQRSPPSEMVRGQHAALRASWQSWAGGDKNLQFLSVSRSAFSDAEDAASMLSKCLF